MLGLLLCFLVYASATNTNSHPLAQARRRRPQLPPLPNMKKESVKSQPVLTTSKESTKKLFDGTSVSLNELRPLLLDVQNLAKSARTLAEQYTHTAWAAVEAKRHFDLWGEKLGNVVNRVLGLLPAGQQTGGAMAGVEKARVIPRAQFLSALERYRDALLSFEDKNAAMLQQNPQLRSALRAVVSYLLPGIGLRNNGAAVYFFTIGQRPQVQPKDSSSSGGDPWASWSDNASWSDSQGSSSSNQSPRSSQSVSGSQGSVSGSKN